MLIDIMKQIKTNSASIIDEKIRYLFRYTDLSYYWSSKYWPSHYIGSKSWNKKNKDIITTHKSHNDKNSMNTDNNINIDSREPDPVNMKDEMSHTEVSEFHSILSYAQDILNSVKFNDTNGTQMQILSLTRYTKSITLVIKAMSTFDTIQKLTKFILEKRQSQQMNVQLHHDKDSIKNNELSIEIKELLSLCVICLDSYQLAGQLIYELLVSQKVSMRYWLPMLEQCAWIDQKTRESLEYIREISTLSSITMNDHSSTASSTSRNTATENQFKHLHSRLQLHGACIYSKLQTYALLHALQHFESSYNHEYFLYYISHDQLEHLKLQLLGMHSAAVLQENKDNGNTIYLNNQRDMERTHNENYLKDLYLAKLAIEQQKEFQIATHENPYPIEVNDEFIFDI